MSVVDRKIAFNKLMKPVKANELKEIRRAEINGGTTFS